jgi:hypothetical protein
MARSMEGLSIRDWYVAMGFIPFAMYAIALSLVLSNAQPLLFWWCIGLAYASLAWLAIDWYFFSRYRQIKKCLGYLGVAAFAILPTWLATISAPLDFAAAMPIGEYPPGTTVQGIQWKRNYSALDAAIINKTDSDYTGVIVHLRTNLMTAQLGIGGENDCKVEPELPGINIMGATISRTDKEGHIISLPLFRSDQVLAATFYRMYCDKILAHSQVNLEIAGEGWPPGTPGKLEWVAFYARYTGAYRYQREFSAQCLIGKCSDMPLNRDQDVQNARLGGSAIVP